MRLAQIARKVKMTPTDIKRFIESEFSISIGKEPNYKLDDQQIEAVLAKFPIPVVVEKVKEPVTKVEETTEDLTEDIIDTPEVETVPENIIEEAVPEITKVMEEELPVAGELDTISNLEVNSDVEEAEVEEAEEVESIEKEEPKSIATEFEVNYEDPNVDVDGDDSFMEASVDVDAELIKVPTVKLDGLKVLGKIELPEKKIVTPEITAEEVSQNEEDAIASLDAAMQSQVQDIKLGKVDQKAAPEVKAHIAIEEESYSEFKDKNGIYHFSHQQKENRKIAKAKSEIRKKAEAEKQIKKRRYEESMKTKPQKTTNNPAKEAEIKVKKTIQSKKKKALKEAPKPKGLWARFVHWLND